MIVLSAVVLFPRSHNHADRIGVVFGWIRGASAFLLSDRLVFTFRHQKVTPLVVGKRRGRSDGQVFDLQLQGAGSFSEMDKNSPLFKNFREDEAIPLILQGTAADVGVRFFESLVLNLAKVLNTMGAWVTEYNAERRRLKALPACSVYILPPLLPG